MSAIITNCEGATIPVKGMMLGSTAFLCVNGPKAMTKIDKELLYQPGVVKMCVNNGSKAVRPNLWTCVDPPDRFLKSVYFDPTIMKFIPQGFCNKKLWDTSLDIPEPRTLKSAPNVFQYARQIGFNPDTFLDSDHICWGQTKGIRSVMLVAMRLLVELGFTTIFIVGCDFHMEEAEPYAFKESKHKGGCDANNRSYKGLNVMFSALRPALEASGVGVYNTYQESGLRAFDYVPFAEAIKFATDILGDVATERTNGMYGIRKRIIAEQDKAKQSRSLSGPYSNEGRLKLTCVSDMLAPSVSRCRPTKAATVCKDKSPSQPQTAAAHKASRIYTASNCWADRGKITSVSPSLVGILELTEQRLEAKSKLRQQGKRCTGCDLTRVTNKFYQEFLKAIPSNISAINEAEILAGYGYVIKDRKKTAIAEL